MSPFVTALHVVSNQGGCYKVTSTTAVPALLGPGLWILTLALAVVGSLLFRLSRVRV